MGCSVRRRSARLSEPRRDAALLKAVTLLEALLKHPTPDQALAHVLQLADEYAATLCCHAKREALDAIRIVREEARKATPPAPST